MGNLFKDYIRKAYEKIYKFIYLNNIYRPPSYRFKYTKYNIPPMDDVPYIINIIYEDIFGYKTDGIFVEVGAFDGETSSFTCFLADIGWTGHYVEPIKKYFMNCLKRHEKNKVLCYNFFIGDFMGQSTMFDYGPFSKKTIVNNFKEITLLNKEAGESVDINCVTMDMFLKNQEIPSEIDLLVIDVEDGEINVLKSFSLLGKEYNPTAIIIEATHENEAKDILTSSGYVQYCSLDTYDPFTKNLIFVSRKRANGKFPLLNKMKKMKVINFLGKVLMWNLFKDYIRKAYGKVRIFTYYNNIYHPKYRHKYTKYNIPSRDDVPYIINIIYEDIFGYKTDGIFVEVGAFDGETSSFTCFLADIGWTGHYVEPIKKYFMNCLKRHEKNKVLCYNFFIGDFMGQSTMFDYGPSSRKNIVNNFKAFTSFGFDKETGEPVNINCLTMDMFLKNQEIPSEIDLLVIDVEDSEINFLKSFSLLGKEYNPTAIIIETTHENETKDILTSAGYVQYCSLDTDDPFTKNLIFVSRKRANSQFHLLDKMKKTKMIPSMNKMNEVKIINFQI